MVSIEAWRSHHVCQTSFDMFWRYSVRERLDVGQLQSLWTGGHPSCSAKGGERIFKCLAPCCWKPHEQATEFRWDQMISNADAWAHCTTNQGVACTNLANYGAPACSSPIYSWVATMEKPLTEWWSEWGLVITSYIHLLVITYKPWMMWLVPKQLHPVTKWDDSPSFVELWYPLGQLVW